ncbi:hypothetical protein ACIQBJ_14630 [Kitasatospora sp. NPDC088391]|uniref:hypothetical protein n=1 Tax=Kitasatospora sp. NPDC088391 TaxID=3364074 RepID=UPI00381A0031
MSPTDTLGAQPSPGPLRTAWRSWRAGGAMLPTSRAGAELAVVVTVVCWRIGTLASMAPAVPTAVAHSTRPWLNAVLIALAVTESAVLLAWMVRRRGYFTPLWPAVDCATALVCLLAEPWYVPDSDLVGTWTGWAPAFAASATMSVAAGAPKRRQTFLLTSVIAACYLLVSLPALDHSAQRAAVFSNTLTYFVFAVLCRSMSSVARRFGTAVDTARLDAVEATRRLEAERSRRLLHDPASLLRYLADPDLDPGLARTVRAQALAEANRIRAHLSEPRLPAGGPTGGGGPGGRLLTEVVREATSGFHDLPMDVLVQLAEGVELPAATAEAVTAAAVTVLHNVRRHAGPEAGVVVHADFQPDDREWELTIRDSGRGFDPAGTPYGYGLTQLVGVALAEQRISSHVHSSPGGGTTVTLRGTVER